MEQSRAKTGGTPKASGALLTCAMVSAVTIGGAAAAEQPYGIGPSYAPVVDWSGPYVGLSFSNDYSDGEAERTRATGFVVETDVSNGLFPSSISDEQWSDAVGLTFGYNFQRDKFVSGVEFSLSNGQQDVDFGFERVDPEILVGVNTITLYGTEIDNLSTLSARAGYAMNKTLIFGKVGVARASVRNDFTLDLTEGNVPLLEFTEDGTRWGYSVGGGVEQKIGHQMSLVAEISYFDLEDTTVKARAPTIFPDNELDYTFQNDGFVTKIGLNFAF